MANAAARLKKKNKAKIKQRNPIAKDLADNKFHQRVIVLSKTPNEIKHKKKWLEEALNDDSNTLD